MNSPKQIDVRQAHKYFSEKCFNAAWDLIRKIDRSESDMDMMVHLAHSSLYHWSKRADCTDQNLSVGYWQLSHVYALADRGEAAVRYAHVCLNYGQQHGVARIFLGYAYEALARAFMVNGEKDQADRYLSKAKEIAVSLDEVDCDQLIADVSTINLD